jgi:hypothetical protein
MSDPAPESAKEELEEPDVEPELELELEGLAPEADDSDEELAPDELESLEVGTDGPVESPPAPAWPTCISSPLTHEYMDGL